MVQKWLRFVIINTIVLELCLWMRLIDGLDPPNYAVHSISKSRYQLAYGWNI